MRANSQADVQKKVKISQTENTAINTHRKDGHHVNVRVEKNWCQFRILSFPRHHKYRLIWFALYVQDTAKNIKKQNTLEQFTAKNRTVQLYSNKKSKMRETIDTK